MRRMEREYGERDCTSENKCCTATLFLLTAEMIKAKAPNNDTMTMMSGCYLGSSIANKPNAGQLKAKMFRYLLFDAACVTSKKKDRSFR